jgi:hypothetical protein
MSSGLIAGAILSALLSATASDPRPLVGGHGNDINTFVAQHDGNSDERLSWDEFDGFRRRRFDATDADRSGAVDVEEYVQEFADRLRQQWEQGRDEQIEQTRRRFGALDSDGNGMVSRAEFDASGERVFDDGTKAVATAAAGKKAGKESADEAAARRDRAPNRFALPSSHSAEGFLALFDGNGDGEVGRAEFDAARRQQFARTDTTADGALNQDEYLAEFEDRLERHVAAVAGGSDRQTRVRFGSMDTDKDGKLTFAEYQVSGKRMFEAADRNRDGMVDDADAKLPPPPGSERAADTSAAAN